MRLLLDTHVVWWALYDSARLSATARDAISDASNDLVFSPVTPWEIAMKHRIGRFPEAATLVATFPESVAKLGMVELPIASRHGLLAGRLEWEHRDPFDRMLAAQSILEGARLVTADRAFSTLPGVDIFW
ncbi:MAG: type II toxin-antitoxin system VapC family toxin [Pseudolysinimonas sp.]|jgi:PIN domain nuclease of toxin-antitoxin system|uniref:type II toxin-antitoxin system VapC family toxin n=1 Tax=Pseudolysinimonas sp. TaxID=2680009 RepID=UPI003C768BAD